MFSPGGWELLVFDAKRIPDIAASLGKGIAEFRPLPDSSARALEHAGDDA